VNIYLIKNVKMDLKEYKEIVNLTAVYPTEVKDFGKCYTLLGFFGELLEVNGSFNREEFIREMYDAVWYLAAICKEFELDFEEIYNKSCHSNDIHTDYNIFEAIKKYYRDGKPFDKEQLTKLLIECATQVLSHLTPKEREYGLQYNYDKLIKRRETNTLHGDGSNREKEV
jgi:NTP pyrophosphatase (non-canonical NTP hydrolase)